MVFQVRDGDSYKEKTVTVKLDENTNAQAASDKQNNDTNQSNSTDEGSSNDNNNDNNNDNSRNSILDGLRDFADWQ